MTANFPYLEIPIHQYLSAKSTNGAISLYSGQIYCSQGEISFSAVGEIELVWLPSPRIQFRVSDLQPKQVERLKMREDLSLKLEDGTEINNCIITRRDTRSEGSFLSGVIVDRVARSTDDQLAYVLFLLPNFQEIVGRKIDFKERSSANRILLRLSNWIITLDVVENRQETFEVLRSCSGIEVTHLGRIEREDGNSFCIEDVFSILEILKWYCSFAIGRWTGPCIPFGFNSSGHQIIEVWDIERQISPFGQSISWLGRRVRSNIFEEPFSGFWARWNDKIWKDALKLSMHWYIEANSQRGSIEGSLVLAQSALELLASVVLLETHHLMSEKEYERLPAFKKIFKLIVWAGIPTSIPPGMEDLMQLSREQGCLNDATKIITEVRNKITHPHKKNRQRFLQLSHREKVEAWTLSLWYLELLLLKLCNYDGQYTNRMTSEFAGQVEFVPWSKHE